VMHPMPTGDIALLKAKLSYLPFVIPTDSLTYFGKILHHLILRPLLLRNKKTQPEYILTLISVIKKNFYVLYVNFCILQLDCNTNIVMCDRIRNANKNHYVIRGEFYM